MNTIGYQIKRARIKAGLTQSEVAQRAAVSQNDISRIESDKVDARLSKIERIVSVLEMDLLITPIHFRSQILGLVDAGEDLSEQTLLDKYGVADDED